LLGDNMIKLPYLIVPRMEEGGAIGAKILNHISYIINHKSI